MGFDDLARVRGYSKVLIFIMFQLFSASVCTVKCLTGCRVDKISGIGNLVKPCKSD